MIKLKEKENTIDMTPTWQSAVKIYMAVLENDKASFEGKKVAREELLKLAKIVDSLKSTND
jgi:hypothetical protein